MPYKDKKEKSTDCLDIEEKENSNVFHRKFFLLDRRKNVLEIYMDNPLNLPQGSQPVNQYNLQFMSNVGDGKTLKQKEQYCFYFTFAGKNIFLRGNDSQDKEEWMEHMKESAKVTVVMREPSSSSSKVSSQNHTSITSESGKNDESYKVEVFGDNIVIKTSIKKSASETDVSKEDEISQKSPSVDMWNPYCQQNEEVKAGYCTKQGQIRKSWKRRYFVLTPIMLSYYKEVADKEAIKSIALADIIEARTSVGIHLNREHVFEVVTGQRVFYIQTDTANERDSWMSAINKCVDSLRKPRPRRLEAHSQTDETLWSYPQSVNSLVSYKSRSMARGCNHGNMCQCITCRPDNQLSSQICDESPEVKASYAVWV